VFWFGTPRVLTKNYRLNSKTVEFALLSKNHGKRSQKSTVIFKVDLNDPLAENGMVRKRSADKFGAPFVLLHVN
jgi:hypothetical protein